MSKLIKLSSLRAPTYGSGVEGVWVDVPDLPGVSLCVRPTNSPRYRAVLANLAREDKAGDITADDVMRLDAEDGALMAEHLLVGWKGFDVPYSADAARAALTHPAHLELRGHVIWAARRAGERKIEYLEAVEKNSEPASAGI